MEAEGYLNPFEDHDDQQQLEEGEMIRPGETEDELLNFDFILENAHVNEEYLNKFEVLGILQGNLQPIDTYLEEYTYKNLDYKINAHKKAD